MNSDSVLRHIAAQRVIPVLRCADVEDAVATAGACAGAGMRVVELTRTTPHVERAIERLAGDEGLLIGLGTITSRRHVVSAARAGASFAVSFCCPPDLVETAHAHGLAAIPGAFTPSEVAACAAVGADAVKLFPAAQAGPGYVAELRAVMPGLRVLATGGLKPASASLGPWLAAGVWAVGLGSALGTAAAVGADEVGRRARAALDVR